MKNFLNCEIVYFTMTNLSTEIQLTPIKLEDHSRLLSFMHKIYGPSYHHLWEDKGHWYVEHIYSRANLMRDLEAINTPYHFISYKSELAGIMRLELQHVFLDLPEKKASKLNRIYLDQKYHGFGIANYLLTRVEEEAKRFGSEILWLEAMDTQKQALRFYQKHGFKIVNRVELDYELLFKPLRGMYRMVKEL